MKADPDDMESTKINHTNRYRHDEGNGDDTIPGEGGNEAFRPDHGSSFVPGAGPEHLAPKSLDHFKRGYEERAAQRDKEFYSVGEGGVKVESEDTLSTSATTSMAVIPASGKQLQHHAPHQANRGAFGRGAEDGGNGRISTYQDDEADDYYLHNEHRGNGNNFISSGSRVGRGGYNGGGASGNRDFNNSRDYGSNNGTGFGGRGGAGARGGGPGGIGSRRYMDDPWGYRDRPTVLQGLDINALMDRLAELSHDTDKLFAELDRVRNEYKQIFDTGKAMTALISVAARRKQIGLGHAVWDWMDLAKLYKNTFHYNSMISVAEKAKNYQQALDLLNEMTDRNIPKNEVT